MRAPFLLLRALPLAASMFCVSLACSSSSSSGGADAGGDSGVDSGPPRSVFTVPSALSALDDDHFFDHPWPSDLRRDADGSVHFDGYINPRKLPLTKKYQSVLKGQIDGFSPVGAGWLAFTATLDTKLLPASAAASVDPSSTLQLVDVDPASPELGQRHPIQWRYREAIGDYYVLPHTLAFMPILGFPLRPKTRYAIVATRDLKTPDGRVFIASDELQSLLDGHGALASSWTTALDALGKAGISRAKIAHLSVFTTADPSAELIKVAAAARALPAPTLTDLKASASTATYDRYTGHYAGSPDYQQGDVPFKESGGSFAFDASGAPIKQRDFSLRFLLVVPKAARCPMPAAGYPIVLYAHGTGGNYASFDNDGTSSALADQCLASMGIDQIFHGERPGAPPDSDPNKESKISLLFFNVENILAARTNPRQAAIDEVARAHFVASGALVVAADVSKSGSAIKFDPARIGFFGHSQGGLNGPLLFAIDDQTRGGVLSGAGSEISYSLLAKTQPQPSVADLVKGILIDVQPENADEVNELHPMISFAQTVIDASDAVNYYGAITRAPFAGRTPKSVLMTEGVNADGTGDSYAPPRTIEAGAIAARYPILQPMVRDIPELTGTAGVPAVASPLKGNMAGGKATGAIAQFSPPAGHDGHFVVFDVPEARLLAAKFCASLLNDAVPTIGGP